jgi:hypothetical protein
MLLSAALAEVGEKASVMALSVSMVIVGFINLPFF